MSYYPAIAGLDLTPGHAPAGPRDLLHAFGEPQSTEIAQRCFGCHTTASSIKRQFDPAHATPGVTCEACHGPGAAHVKAMQQNSGGNTKDSIAKDPMIDPSTYSPVKLVDYCGACHRAALDVAGEKDMSAINVRFQPYRLSKSRCWSKPDDRIACTGCHDPHLPLETDPLAYDGKCLACHAVKAKVTATPAATASLNRPTARTEKACPISANRCVTCHMPRYKISQLHGGFTDHDIRIVRDGEKYPL